VPICTPREAFFWSCVQPLSHPLPSLTRVNAVFPRRTRRRPDALAAVVCADVMDADHRNRIAVGEHRPDSRVRVASVTRSSQASLPIRYRFILPCSRSVVVLVVAQINSLLDLGNSSAMS
jgi:hypothetical protein